MKTITKQSTSKLIIRFDNELKKLLAEDLKVFKQMNQFLNGFNNQDNGKQLSAA